MAIDLDTFDKKYSIDGSASCKGYTVFKNDSGFDIFKGEYKVSEILEKINSGEFPRVEFHCNSCFNLEDFIATKLLNDEIKVLTHNRSVLIFGSLDHFGTKKAIGIPEDYLDLEPDYTKETYSIANQVLWLEEVKEENREVVECFRRTLKNLLKYNQSLTAEDILNES